MNPTGRPRVLIADDHALIAEALSKLLFASFDVVATVHDGRSLIREGQRLKPDVILADIGLPLLNGLDAVCQFKRLVPEAKVVYVTVNHDPDLVSEAFRRGASAYLLKTAAASELVTAIHLALKGEVYVSSLLRADLANVPAPTRGATPSASELTDRQVEVLQLLAEGKSMKEAAAVLNLTTRTVAFHKYRIMANLQLRNDADLVRYAMQHHLVFD